MNIVFKIFFVSLLLAVFSGCGNGTTIDKKQPSTTPVAINTFSELPETLSWTPQYPEPPIKTVIKEYNDGWELIYRVPNALPIAKDAWLTQWGELGWNTAAEFAPEESVHSWTILKKDGGVMYIHFEEISDEETLFTTYVRKE